MARSVEGLSPQERIVYYRAMSAVALRLAQASDDITQKASFLDNAASWLALANEVEHFAERIGDMLLDDRTAKHSTRENSR